MTRKTQFASTATGLILLAALAGCTGAATATRPSTTAEPAAAGPAISGDLSGKVVEAMDAGGYSYICLEKAGKKTWIAAPLMKVTLGQELKFFPGAVMKQFTSKALNRTFDEVVFSGGVDAAPAQPAAAEAKPNYQETDEEILTGKVVKTMDASNYTYILVEKDGKAAWSAVPTFRVQLGDQVEVQPGTPMGQFTSKLLGVTFKSIYFASGVKVLNRDNGAAPAEGAAAAAEPAAQAADAAPGQKSLVDSLPPSHPKIDMQAARKAVEAQKQAKPQAAAGPITGKVVETAEAGGYTYICLENNGEKTWVATQPMQVEIGSQLSLKPGAVMSNFASRSLNRTFEKIIFSDGVIGK